jgi:hypothetical protein
VGTGQQQLNLPDLALEVLARDGVLANNNFVSAFAESRGRAASVGNANERFLGLVDGRWIIGSQNGGSHLPIKLPEMDIIALEFLHGL